MVLITRNFDKGGFELKFSAKPTPTQLDWLKANKYRWNSSTMVWWKKFDQASYDSAHEYFGVENKSQLQIGIAIEKEHTNDIIIAEKIAMDHLKENPNYYKDPKPANWAEKELKQEAMPVEISNAFKKEILFLIGLKKDKEQNKPNNWDINLFKASLYNAVKTLHKGKHQNEVDAVLNFLEKTNREMQVSDVFTKNHAIWKLRSGSITKKNAESNENEFMGVTANEFLLLNITYAYKTFARNDYLKKHDILAKKEDIKNALIDKGYMLRSGAINEPGKRLVKQLRKVEGYSDHMIWDKKDFAKFRDKHWPEIMAENDTNQKKDIVNPIINENIGLQKMLKGREIEISMPNGEKHKAVFAIVELNDIIASHDEETFHTSPGYPVNAAGNNINDRNYKDDPAAQKAVMDYARELEPERLITTSRTPSGTPIINKDGIVVSSNNRTMSLKLAAKQYPENYKEYIKYLADEIEAYGFDQTIRFNLMHIGVDDLLSRISLPDSSFYESSYIQFMQPVLIRIDYDIKELTTQELAKYNKDTKKAERPIDKAIKLSNILIENPNCANIIAETVGDYDTFTEFYANLNAQKRLAKQLIECNILTYQELPAFFSDTTFTETGKEFVENLLASVILNREALMASDLPGVRAIREKLITVLPVLMKNASLPEGSLKQNFNDAVLFQQKMVASGLSFHDFIRQRNMFGDTFDKKTVYVNRLIESGKIKFKKAIEGYNEAVVKNQGNSLFGEKPSNDEIFKHWIIQSIEETESKLIESSPIVEQNNDLQESKQVKQKSKLIKTDRDGNYIGDGSYNIDPVVYDFKEFPQIKSEVNKSFTTETTYVKYFNIENGKTITVRFSNHVNNAVKFGDQLDGNRTTKDEVLFHLGLKNRVFIPKTYLFIATRQVAKKDLGNYQESDKTIKELYSLGKGADISEYVGKLAKGSNYLITGNKINEFWDQKSDSFGNTVNIGDYTYTDIEVKSELQKANLLKIGDAYADFVLNELEKKFNDRFPGEKFERESLIAQWLKTKEERGNVERSNSIIEDLYIQYLPLTQWPNARGELKKSFENNQKLLLGDNNDLKTASMKKYVTLKQDFSGEKAFTMGEIVSRPNMFVTDVLFSSGKTYQVDNTFLTFVKNEVLQTDFNKAYTMNELNKIYSYENGYNVGYLEVDNIVDDTMRRFIKISKLRGTYPNFEREPKHHGFIFDDYKWYGESEPGKYKESASPYVNKEVETPETKEGNADKAVKDIMTLRKFVNHSQMDALSNLMMSEEREAADEIIERLSGIIAMMPKTYETSEIQSNDQIIYLHYFNSGSDWYIVEKDAGSKDDEIPGVQQQAYGYAILNGDKRNAEWGYISIVELLKNNVELDFHFTPIKFGVLKLKWDPEFNFGENEEVQEPIDSGIASEEIIYPNSQNKNDLDIDEDWDIELGKKYIDIYNDRSAYITSHFSISGVTKDGMNYTFRFTGSGEVGIDFSRNMQVHSYNPKSKEKGEQIRDFILDIYNLTIKTQKPDVKDIFPEIADLNESQYKNAYEINVAIEALLNENWNKPLKFWDDKKDFISQYSGYGGLDDIVIKSGGKLNKGSFMEYYTPEMVIEKMWGLAYKYGYKEGPVTEPSVSIGAFFNRKFVKDYVQKTGYEINKYSAKICKILYPEANINGGHDVMNFEQVFLKNNYTLKGNIIADQELVIGNPPYGEFSGPYIAMGEKGYTNARNWIEYFITRGLDLLKSGGLLIYIIGVEVANGGTPWLDQGMSKAKEAIAQKADLIDAYRLPEGVFERTGVVSDIIVFRKK